MSDSFYSYIANHLISYFNNKNIKKGDKFLINFNNKSDVEGLYNALENKGHYDEYKDDEMINPFKFFYLKFEDIKIVVAKLMVDSGFLVKLRNKVSSTDEWWADKALLILSDKSKDSINEAMVNLQDEGYPLNIDVIKKNFDKEIKNSSLKPFEKDILNVFLDNHEETELFKTTLWDFKAVLSILNNKTIVKKDYEGLNLFYDSGLEDKDSLVRPKRLLENFELFSKIRNINNLDNAEKDYVKFLDDKGIKYINRLDNWQDADFKELKKSMNRFKKLKKKINILNSSVDGLDHWNKSEKDTTAGKRNRHIIIFNPDFKEKIKIELEFDTDLDRNFFIGDDSKRDGKIRKTKMIFNFNVDEDIVFKKYQYKHNKLSSNNFNFYICVLKCSPVVLQSIKEFYSINKSNLNKIEINQNEGLIDFGDENQDTVYLYEDNQIIENNVSLDINQSFLNSDKEIINFSVHCNDIFIPFSIKKIVPDNFPISSLDVWKKKIFNKQDFIKIEDTLKQGDNLYNFKSTEFKDIVELEKQLIDNNVICGNVEKGKITKIDIKLPVELKEAYDELFEFYKNKNNVPSLVYVDSNLKKIFSNIIDIFNKEVDGIKEKSILKTLETKKDLLKIGMVEYNNKIWFSSISILNIAFQLEVLNNCKSDDIDNKILNKLVPNNLLPYLYDSNDELLKSLKSSPAKEWLCYDEISAANIGGTNVYVEKIVQKILTKFVDKFDYLFSENSIAPLKINVINIENDKEVIKGIFKFMRNRLPDKRKTGGIIPVEVHIYNKNHKTEFKEFFECNTEDKLKKDFELTFKSNLDSSDVIRLIQNNIEYFIHVDSDFEYSHISFYKVLGSSDDSELEMSQIDTGIVLDGLMSSIPSVYHGDYRSGFGIKYADADKKLIKTAIHLNELAYNSSNHGASLYSKNKSIVTLYDEETVKLNHLFEKSHWVTFIEPTFGLDYFSNNDNDKLFVVHYSDQYSASSQYDTITLTAQVTPYKKLISEFLDQLSFDQEKDKETVISEVIRIFNSVNGEWLLNVELTNNAEKEKLSIISAIKYALAIFNHEDILWIPISMEEILRVAGNTGLKESAGLFSIKTLIGEKKGNKYSDDFLMMGFNVKTNEMYYFPVEVKMGSNTKNYIEKGIKQVNTTYSFLREYLVDSSNSKKIISPFRKKFYRNFFVQLYLINLQKFINNKIWPEKQFERIDEYKNLLLSDEYEISYRLKSKIGKGAVISFKEDVVLDDIYKDGDFTIIELPRINGEKGMTYSIEEFIEKIKQDLDSSELDDDFDEDSDLDSSELDDDFDEDSDLDDSSSLPKLEDIKIYLGDEMGTDKKIYWEFGNSKQGNRHMLIQGQSGSGKTYFTQKLIKGLSSQHIPCLIIDYSNSLGVNKIDDSLKNYLGENLKEYYVHFDKFPLNPFKSYPDIDERDGSIRYQNNNMIAGRLKSIFISVFGLGTRQSRKVASAIKKGLTKYGEDMTIGLLEEELENDGSSHALGALERMDSLFEEEIFKYDNAFDWSILDSRSNNVIIIQLNKLSAGNKIALTEMILWDLWYYKEQFGDKSLPFAVILDEAHNLSYKNGTPPFRILKEGRGFGWSAIFATQAIKGVMDAKDISTLDQVKTKVFFHPDDNSMGYISSLLSSNPKNRKQWEYTLRSLEMGECVVYTGGNKIYTINVPPFNQDNESK